MTSKLLFVSLVLISSPSLCRGEDPAVNPWTHEKRMAGELWTATSIDGMKFRWCPPGKFLMGASASDRFADDDEASVEVGLTRGFWIGACEVSQKEWSVMSKERPWDTNRDAVDGDSLPAMGVSFHDSVTFCERVTEHLRTLNQMPKDWSCTLPTEAEWEWACRAGSKSLFYFGDDANELAEHAWFHGASVPPPTAPRGVGGGKPNAWGLHDTAGNVLEWCLDGYETTVPGGQNPFVEGNAYRVLRGGCFVSSTYACRSSKRVHRSPKARLATFGLRVMLRSNNPLTISE